MADENGRCRARNSRHVVMLREPEARVPPVLGVTREIDRVAVAFRNASALAHRGEVKNGEARRRVGHVLFDDSAAPWGSAGARDDGAASVRVSELRRAILPEGS